MPKRTIRCRRIKQQGGRIYVQFSDKAEIEADSRAELKRWVAEKITDEVVKALLIAAVLEDAANGVPLTECDGKRITLDWAAASLLTVEAAQ